MRIVIHSVWLLFLLGGCKEPVGAKIPRPNKKAAAAVTAAVAGAMTLANPASAGRIPESSKNKRARPKKVKEVVTPGALDRLDDKKANPEKKPPCPAPKPKTARTGADAKKLSIVPKPPPARANGIQMHRPCTPPPAKKKARTR